MDSSTFHSKGWLPRQAAGLLLVALGAWTACAVYTIHFNPEVADCAFGEAIKNTWAEKMTREYGAKVVVFGGSSCEFSIDGERMLKEFNLPTVNDGEDAGIGASVLTEAALRHLRRGDTLIIGLEPILLTRPLVPSALAAQFSLKAGHPEWVIHPTLGVGGIHWFQLATDLRPGGSVSFTMLGKFAIGRHFRYKPTDYRVSGWKQTDVRMELTGREGLGGRLSDGSVLLLRRLGNWCETNGVRAAYSLPWEFAPDGVLGEDRKEDVHFLLQMEEFFPILKDPYLGCDPNRSDFADTDFHLVTPAAEKRTDELAQQILHWNVWTVAELEALGKAPTTDLVYHQEAGKVHQ